MRFTRSIFGKLLEPINRRQFDAIVARHDGNAYDKRFESWDHLQVLIFAQFSAAEGLRGLEASWNANSQHHYHLGSGPIRRTTVSDAGKRRPVGVFVDTFNLLCGQLDRHTRQDSKELIRLIDSTPIPLGALIGWAKSNGRFKGLKVHVVYDPAADIPRVLDITAANVNDAQIGRTLKLERGATGVFDKGYCHYGWWKQINDAGAFFVTRPKSNMRLEDLERRTLDAVEGDGFTVLEDVTVNFASKGDSKLDIPLRRVKVLRHADRKILDLLTNDMARPAVKIAALYKARWQIELFFRWIKQHLKIRKFLGKNENAIRLQIFAAMIAYALLRIAIRACAIEIPVIRFTDLVAQCIFDRRDIAAIDKPPPINPSTPKPRTNLNQLAFSYA